MQPSEKQLAPGSHQNGSVGPTDTEAWRREVTEFLSTFLSELDFLKTELDAEQDSGSKRVD